MNSLFSLSSFCWKSGAMCHSYGGGGMEISALLPGGRRQRAAGLYHTGSFEERRLYNWKQSITSPLAPEESWFSSALNSQFTPVQIECKATLAGACILYCCECLESSGRRREGSGSCQELDGSLSALSLVGEVCWLGHCAFSALLGAAELLLKLILVCFLYSPAKTCWSWFWTHKGVGSKGDYSGERWGGLLSLSPSTLRRHDSPDPELCLLPFSLPARPLSKKIKDSNGFRGAAKEKYKSAFTTDVRKVGPAAFRMEEQG